MALSQSRWGVNVADALRAWAQANVPQNAFITDNQLRDAWIVITGQHRQEINDNADIDLESNDITVSPGTFIDAETRAITGQGFTNAATLNQRIK